MSRWIVVAMFHVLWLITAMIFFWTGACERVLIKVVENLLCNPILWLRLCLVRFKYSSFFNQNFNKDVFSKVVYYLKPLNESLERAFHQTNNALDNRTIVTLMSKYLLLRFSGFFLLKKKIIESWESCERCQLKIKIVLCQPNLTH